MNDRGYNKRPSHISALILELHTFTRIIFLVDCQQVPGQGRSNDQDIQFTFNLPIICKDVVLCKQ